MSELDDILRRIAYWNGYDSAGEWERTGHEAKAQLEQYIAQQVREARIDELNSLLKQSEVIRIDGVAQSYGLFNAAISDRIAALKGDIK